MKKILIAGGAGYIGTRLSNELHERGYNVVVWDLLWFGKFLNKEIKLVKKDIFLIDDTFLRGFDCVIFLAGVSNDPMAEYSPSLSFIYNASCPSFLAYMSKKAGVPRFIYASSCSIYGNTGTKLNKESSLAMSDFPYGLSKLQGEFPVWTMQDKNFSVICLRMGTVSGFSSRMRFDLLVNTIYMRAITEGKIVVDKSKVWRPIFAMSDVVDVYIKAIEAKSYITGVFNASSGNYSLEEVVEIVRKYFKERHGINLGVQVVNIENVRTYKVNTQKIKRILKVDFKGTVESILEELDKNIGKNFDFSNDKYFNVRMFMKIKIDQIFKSI